VTKGKVAYYYPFGMQMPGRGFTSGDGYRYGFNGMERDDEVKGSGNQYTTEFRGYDPRLGKWLSTDPVTHPHFSPYSAFDNNPVYWVDPNGANTDGYTVDEQGKIERVDDTGGDEFDVLYKKSEYEAAKSSGETNSQGNPEPQNKVKVDDTNILFGLSQRHSQMKQVDWFSQGMRTTTYDPNTGEWSHKYNLNYLQGQIAFSRSETDVRNVFEFAAVNSSVEWSLEGSKNGNWAIGALIGGTSQALSMGYITGFKENNKPIIQIFGGFEVENKIYDAHSHPDSDPIDDFNPSDQDVHNASSARKINPSIRFQLFTPKNPNQKWQDF
jgi:RHS repeat-associated protein